MIRLGSKIHIRLGTVLFATLILAFLATPATQAHAALVRSEPPANATLAQSPGVIRLWFSEPLVPDLSQASVLDQAGQRVDGGLSRVAADDPKRLELGPIRNLARGVYTVVWTSVSTLDGHTLRGSFVFGVGTTPLNSAAEDRVSGLTFGSQGGWPGIVFYWLKLLSVLAATGATLFQRWVIQPEAQAATDRRARLYVFGMLVLAVLSGLALLSVQDATLVGAGTKESSTSTLGRLLLGTRYGLATLVNLGLTTAALVILGVSSLFRARPAQPSLGIVAARSPGLPSGAVPPPVREQVGLTPVLALLLVSLCAMAFSGHAAAVEQPFLASVALDWVHLAAAAIWVGGILFVAIVLLPAMRTVQGSALIETLSRFTPFALGSVGLLVLTGLFNAEVQLGSLEMLFGSLYGQILLAKLGLMVMVGVSYWHAFVLRPRLIARAREGQPTDGVGRQLGRWLRFEPILGLFVLLTVALLAAFPVTPGERSAVRVDNDTPAIAAERSLRLREAAGKRLVTLHVTPNDLGENRFEVVLHESGGRLVGEALVRLRTTFLDGDLGSTYLVTEPTVPGRFAGSGAFTAAGQWRVEVLIRERSGDEASTTFTFQVPTAGALAVLRQVDAAMNQLMALREENHIGPTTTGSTLFIQYSYAAPDRLHVQVETGSENIFVGRTRYDRITSTEAWRSSSLPGSETYRWPHYDFARTATDVTILGQETLDGQPMLVLGFIDPSIDAYYRLWVGLHDYLIRKETMMSTGHYMTSYFSNFNGSVRIEPPTMVGSENK